MKRLYVARTSDDDLLLRRDPSPDQDTGKFKRNVRFKFENADENKIDDNRNSDALELQKKRTIVLSSSKKAQLYCCGTRAAAKSDQRLARLYHRGQQKLAKDFDVLKIMKDLHHYRILFDYVKKKHSNLMIDVNSSRKNVINLHDDGWEFELERCDPYLTKHETYQTRSSDEQSDKSETSEAPSQPSSQVSRSEHEPRPRSPTSTSKSESAWSAPKEPENENTETVPEDVEQFKEDFDDINESEHKEKNIYDSRAGQASFEARKSTPKLAERKHEFLEKNKKYLQKAEQDTSGAFNSHKSVVHDGDDQSSMNTNDDDTPRTISKTKSDKDKKFSIVQHIMGDDNNKDKTQLIPQK